MKRILISGDSWGCGEWNEWATANGSEYGISHPGLEQYLIDDGFFVVNCSMGNLANKDSIGRLEHQLCLGDYDHIIWFQSDPLRDLRPYKNFNHMFTDYQQILASSNELLNSHYKRLNQLGKKIICIGGCSKLDPDISNYENLIPLVSSVIELLLPDFTAPRVWCSDWVHHINSKINESLLDCLLIEKKIQDQIGEQPIFQPDGRHPNRKGHRVLFDVVRKFLS